MKSLFENRQWRVVQTGMESVDGRYLVAANRLGETTTRSGVVLRNWPVHLAEKDWVDIEAFIDAFDKTLAVHAGRYAPLIDPQIAGRSYDFARKLAKEYFGR